VGHYSGDDMSTAIDGAKNYMIRLNAFCSDELEAFYSCTDREVKERLKLILENKKALFDRQYLMEREV